MRKFFAAALLALSVIGFSASAQAATGPTVTGAGSTWVQIILDQWRADIARQGYAIYYQASGASAGRALFIANSVDFAASEIPFQPDELAQLQAQHRSYQYVPDVAGGLGIMYNLHTPTGARITSLQLDANTLAGIFTGTVTSWQDPAIAALNPGLQVRETRLIPVTEASGSATSAQLSLYLHDQAAGTWNAFAAAQGCPAPCSFWPQLADGLSQASSNSMANFVADDNVGSGSITYVEYGYAAGRGFPVASLKNASGGFSQPTATNVWTALAHATLNSDLTQNLAGTYRAPEANAYPLSYYGYLITPTAGFDTAKGFVLGTWILYDVCAGQREAAPLGYAPLPPNLVQAAFDAVGRIPGAPVPPPLDYAHCPNPTLVITPASVRADVVRAFDSGEIQGEGIETSLLAKLDAAAAARSIGDCATAADVYNAFINEVDAQGDKRIAPGAAMRLTNEAQYLIAHCP